jgi:hypothetical protein
VLFRSRVYITRLNHISVSVEFTMRFACVFVEVDLRKTMCTSAGNVRGSVLSITLEWGWGGGGTRGGAVG